MEVSSALGIPYGAPFLTSEVRVVPLALVLVPYGIADAAPIARGFVAESAVVAELAGAVLPADGAHPVDTLPAQGVAEGAILLVARVAGGDNLPDTSAIGVFPAGGTQDRGR